MTSQPGTLKGEILLRVKRAPRRSVFLTRDFSNLASPPAVSRALRQLVTDGRLVRLGYGLYARATRSLITGAPVLAARGGFVGASRAALDRLGVAWEPTQIEVDFRAGRTTQIPVNAVVRIRGRLRRRISYRSMELTCER